jgi:6-phosphogluconolactonase
MNDTTAQAHPLVAVGCYAAADQPGIYFFRLDERSGALTACGAYAGIVNPSFVLAHPNRRWLYAVSETSQRDDGAAGAVWALRYEGQPPTVEPLNQQPSGGDHPCHLLLDESGRWLLVSNYSSGALGVLPILDDGALGAITDLVQHHGRSVDSERQEGPHAHSAIFTPDQRYVIVADLGLDQLLLYAFDPEAGKLSAHVQTDTRPGAGPRHMVFDPSGRRLYVANELNNTVSVYDYDADHGALRERQTLATLPDDAGHSQVADIHIAPGGHRVYVSNRGHNSIAVFEVEADGELTHSAIRPCGGDWPRNFALAPCERWLLAANQYSGDVVTLPLLADAQALGDPVARTTVDKASCIAIVATDE